MNQDIDVPVPPDITNRGLPEQFDADEPVDESDLRRGDLESVLRSGAWREGFDEWAQYTELDRSDVDDAHRLGLFGAFDFYWDGDGERLRYVVPEVPESWDERADEASVTRTILQGELDDLGRTVAETIATDYVDWGDEERDDLVWGVESFGQVPTEE